MGKKLSLFLFLILILASASNGVAGEVKTTGYFPIKSGTYDAVETTGDTGLATEEGSVGMGTPATANSAAVEVVGGTAVSGTLKMESPIQIQLFNCEEQKPGIDCVQTEPGKIWLLKTFTEKTIDED